MATSATSKPPRLRDLVGRPFDEVAERLRGEGIEVEARVETVAPPLLLIDRLRREREVASGDRVVAHVVGNRVVRFTVNATAQEEAAAEQREQRLVMIEKRLAALEKAAGIKPPSTRTRRRAAPKKKADDKEG